MSVKCSGCGKIFESNPPKFCDDCGTALAAPTQSAQPVQQPKPQPIQPRPQAPQQPSAQGQHTSQQLPLTNSAPNPQYAQSPQTQYAPPMYSGQQQQQQQSYYAPPQYNQYQPMGQPMTSNTSPLSVGGFMITQLVLMIPLVGLIMAIVWAVGGQNTNVNRTNFCRSYFIWTVIGLVVGIIGGIIFGAVIAPLIVELITEMSGSYGSSYYW